MAFAPGDEEVELGPDWIDSDPEWAEIPDWLIDEVINFFLADTDAGEYF